jgi:hypothetical protein
VTVYRVGEQGATVFSAEGDPVTWLPPGHLVVAGSTELRGTPAAEHHDDQQKRRHGYADKQLRPTEDKTV